MEKIYLKKKTEKKEYYFGIKSNGVFHKIEEIQFDSDQSEWDYLCEARLCRYEGGNGTFRISFKKMNSTIGMQLHNWELKEGQVAFGFNESWQYFTLIDKNGEETSRIKAGNVSMGSVFGGDCNVSYVHVELQISPIICKAEEIANLYPSAAIYNAFDTFKKKDSINITPIIDVEIFMNKTLPLLNGFYQDYERIKLMLELCDHPRASQLMKELSEFAKTIIR